MIKGGEKKKEIMKQISSHDLNLQGQLVLNLNLTTSKIYSGKPC